MFFLSGGMILNYYTMTCYQYLKVKFFQHITVVIFNMQYTIFLVLKQH